MKQGKWSSCTIETKLDIRNMSFNILQVNYNFERILTQN